MLYLFFGLAFLITLFFVLGFLVFALGAVRLSVFVFWMCGCVFLAAIMIELLNYIILILLNFISLWKDKK